jgi:hypothetical protein
VVTDDRHGAAEALIAELGQLTVDDALSTPYLLIGSVDDIVEQLQTHRARWGISYYITFEPAIDALAPVVARLAGT